MAAGDFTASDVPRLKLSLDNAWADSPANQKNRVNDPTTGVLKAVLDNDTASIKRQITLNDGCQGVEITWLEGTVPATIVSGFETHTVIPCSITGAMPESKKVDYKITHYAKASFKLKESICNNMMNFGVQYMHMMMLAERDLIKQIAQFLLAKLHAFAGTNRMAAYSEPLANNIGVVDPGNPNLTRVSIENMRWDDFVPWWVQLSAVNRMTDPYVIDGYGFTKQKMLAKLQDGTTADNGADDGLALLNRFYSDPVNFATAGIFDRMFTISRGAVAPAFMNVNPDNPEDLPDDMIRYREPFTTVALPAGMNVQKDVFVVRSKENHPTQAGHCELYRTFEVWVPFDFFLNPVATGDTYTGVLELKRDVELPRILTY